MYCFSGIWAKAHEAYNLLMPFLMEEYPEMTLRMMDESVFEAHVDLYREWKGGDLSIV